MYTPSGGICHVVASSVSYLSVYVIELLGTMFYHVLSRDADAPPTSCYMFGMEQVLHTTRYNRSQGCSAYKYNTYCL